MRLVIAGLFLLGAAGATLADVAPDPEDIDDMVAQRLRNAGQECPRPWRVERLSAEDEAYSAERNVVAQRIVCPDGTRYLVSYLTRRRRTGGGKHFVQRLP